MSITNPNDQANQLRRLVHDASRQVAARAPSPWVLLLLGANSGVGATTVAVRLAGAIAGTGNRTVLIDADPQGGNIACSCGIDDRRSLADVIAGHCKLQEVLQPGPGGIEIVPGAWGLDLQAEALPGIGYGWTSQVADLGARADVVVIDGGSAASCTVERLASLADLGIVVGTADAAAITEFYARFKNLSKGNPRLPLQCLVNRAADSAAAQAVFDRIAQTSLRHLSVRPRAAGHLPDDAAWRAGLERRGSSASSRPESPAERQIDELAQRLVAAYGKWRQHGENREFAMDSVSSALGRGEAPSSSAISAF